ncbi:uncharacterized protein LOC117338561 [Pecten maximus]|uniref:uncharacterized protein LOC117338561 n=1 Tax=Pecten maximus TaxID=6579 RepID=UPI001458473D|nr:uncharacterized protein LOC117338561 [Pecten maximus]
MKDHVCKMRHITTLMQCTCILSFLFIVYNLAKYHIHDKRTDVPLQAQKQIIGSSENRSNTPELVPKSCTSNYSYIDFGTSMTPEQLERVEHCMINYNTDGAKGLQQTHADKNIRYKSHSYLNSNSFMIEAGGHQGLDANEFNSRYHPGVYVILEPVAEFFEILKQKFKNSSNIVLYNFGVDVRNRTFLVNRGDDATSIFSKHKGNVKLQILAVSRFFEMLRISEKKVDLITLNCEGCEYAILDYLLSTNNIHQFRNIQFQSHRVPAVCHPVKRFCWYQELLPKTHKLVFQHKFWWESWTEK